MQLFDGITSSSGPALGVPVTLTDMYADNVTQT
jgi:hypothetical protein